MARIEVPDVVEYITHATNAIILLSLLISIGTYIYLSYFYPDLPRISGIPEPPGASLVYGHLPILGNDHATASETWSRANNWPIFQTRLGYRRVIVLNSFNAAKDWLITNSASTIDRPQFYTFHKVVSKTSAATIGTNPWNERTRKQRLVAGSLTTAPAMKRMTSLLDMELADLLTTLAAGKGEIVPHIHLKKVALNIILMWCYGRRFEHVHDTLLDQILSDATLISTFRSTSLNSQDFVPHLRYMPRFLQDRKRMAVATEVRTRRDKWLADLLEGVRRKIEAGKATDCVAAGLFGEGHGRLTEHDIRTILGGLVSGGFDTIANTAIAGIMYLTSPEGQAIQETAYQDIIRSYGSAEAAFKNAMHEEKSAYVVAFVREVLRFYPPIKILPPRQVYKDFTDSNGVRVPAGVVVLVNCQAINRDSSIYGPDADIFKPERWLDNNIPPPYHFAYGAGSRVCTAVNFSNRILYAIFVRLILNFRMRGSEDGSPCLDYIEYNRDTGAATACPKDFKATFELRDLELFKTCLRDTRRDGNGAVSNGILKKQS